MSRCHPETNRVKGMAKRPILTNGTIVRASLADGQPGGRVRLGNQALSTSEGARRYVADYFATQLSRHDFGDYILTELAADFACALAHHLSAQPSPGGQGDSRSEKAETFLRQYLTYLRSSPRQGLRPRWCDVYEALEVAIEALAARQPVGEVSVKKEDANNYCLILRALGMEEEGDPVAEVKALIEARDRQPVGEPVAWMTHHDEPMLFPTAAEAAAYCEDDEQPVPLYAAPPAQAVDLDAVRALLQRRIEQWRSHLPADPGAPGTREIETKGEHDYNNDVRIYREGIAVMEEVLSKIDSQAVGNG